MKKAYINPTTEVINVELQQFCEASVGIGENYDGDDSILSGDEIDVWSIISK